MRSEDPNLRGLAVWAVSPILSTVAIECVKQLTEDPAALILYRNGKLAQYSVGQLAREALAWIDQPAKA